MTPNAASTRDTVFISHAAPEDNDFALWLSAKLTVAGYKVWLDVRKLRGGDDFWDDIERALKEDAVKQLVVFSTCPPSALMRQVEAFHERRISGSS